MHDHLHRHGLPIETIRGRRDVPINMRKTLTDVERPWLSAGAAGAEYTTANGVIAGGVSPVPV